MAIKFPLRAKLTRLARAIARGFRRVNMSTLDLTNSTKILRPTLIVAPLKRTNIVDITPVPKNKTIYFKGQAFGASSLYPVLLVAYKMEFVGKQDAKHPISVTTGKGQPTLWTNQIDYRKTPVQIRCTCKDYYFRWWYWNFQRKSLAGPRMKPYQRKTKTWPEANPRHAPGMCKHLVAYTRLLQDRKIMTK